MEEKGGFGGEPGGTLKAFKYRRLIGPEEGKKSVEKPDGMRLENTGRRARVMGAET